MTLLYYNKGIRDYTRIKLARLYKKLSGSEFIPPADDYVPKTLKVDIKPEEIEQEMRKRPKGKVRA